MTESVLRTLALEAGPVREVDLLLSREWLVTNGLGGYASGSVPGACTRRYHGLLVAALPAPHGRVVMLSHIADEVRMPTGEVLALGGEEATPGSPDLSGAIALDGFRLEMGLPVWTWSLDGGVLEKRLHLPHLQNTVHVTWRRLGGRGPVRLRIRPSLGFRPHEAPVDAPLAGYVLSTTPGGYEIDARTGDLPPLRITIRGGDAAFVLDGGSVRTIHYRVERSRGYPSTGTLWSPGYLRVTLQPGGCATMVASTESWPTIDALDTADAWDLEITRRQRLLTSAPPPAREGPAAELVLAADSFVVVPRTRIADAARVRAAGDEACSVIAGYHWFTDWGRDTMISLDGLTLATGRELEAGRILRTFAQSVRHGLVPNLFPEGEREGLYHTADATLWYFHALSRYLDVTGDRTTLRLLLPTLIDIVAHHRRGTRFGIGVDPEDGLLRQGAPGYQLTWMDAKVGDWVVTPRRGKAVEINALWYNALRLLEGWLAEEGGSEGAQAISREADRVLASFNRRFWYAPGRHLYDVVDGEAGDDPAFRPNQLFAISLLHPVLDPSRWAVVVEAVQQRLLTPVGLRSLAPCHPDYKPTYDGDLRARDAAYHQGTVWGWLIGPFIDAWLKVHPEDRAGARRFLDGFVPHLGEAAVGSISEIFDAEPPFTPRGCVAQAWSVAEVLRCWLLTR